MIHVCGGCASDDHCGGQAEVITLDRRVHCPCVRCEWVSW